MPKNLHKQEHPTGATLLHKVKEILHVRKTKKGHTSKTTKAPQA